MPVWSGVSCPLISGLSCREDWRWSSGESKTSRLMRYLRRLPPRALIVWTLAEQQGTIGSNNRPIEHSRGSFLKLHNMKKVNTHHKVLMMLHAGMMNQGVNNIQPTRATTIMSPIRFAWSGCWDQTQPYLFISPQAYSIFFHQLIISLVWGPLILCEMSCHGELWQ